MTEQPKELLSLQKSMAPLEEIQSGFDAYQENHFTTRPPEFFALELNGEAGELANLEKKAWRGNDVTAERYCDEAADVFITLMNYCNARGVNLAEAVNEKLGRIEVRRQDGKY